MVERVFFPPHQALGDLLVSATKNLGTLSRFDGGNGSNNVLLLIIQNTEREGGA